MVFYFTQRVFKNKLKNRLKLNHSICFNYLEKFQNAQTGEMVREYFEGSILCTGTSTKEIFPVLKGKNELISNGTFEI